MTDRHETNLVEAVDDFLPLKFHRILFRLMDDWIWRNSTAKQVDYLGFLMDTKNTNLVEAVDDFLRLKFHRILFRCLSVWRTTGFDETRQEANPQRPPPSLWVFFVATRNPRESPCLAETSSLQPLNRFLQNLTGKESSASFTNFLFWCRSVATRTSALFVSIGNTRWPPWPLIG